MGRGEWQNSRLPCLHAPINFTLPLAGESSVSEVRVKWLATPTAMQPHRNPPRPTIEIRPGFRLAYRLNHQRATTTCRPALSEGRAIWVRTVVARQNRG